jgi:hypothetical protein
VDYAPLLFLCFIYEYFQDKLTEKNNNRYNGKD